MCEKHIKLFFCVHRREADDTLFVFILTEGSAAFAYDIIQFFRNTVKAGKAICSTMPGSVLEPGIAMLIIVSF